VASYSARHPRILRRVEPATRGTDDIVESTEQGGHLATVAEIDRQGHAFVRKAQQSRRLALRECLEHREEGAFSRSGDRVEHGARGFKRRRARHHTLILKESLRPVEAVPVEHRVERIQERLVMDDLHAGLPLTEPVVERVAVVELDGDHHALPRYQLGAPTYPAWIT